MGVIIKQSFWGTFIAYVGVIVGYVNTLYLRPKFFELDQIGLFTLITANAMIVSPVSTLGMGSSFIKFFPSFKASDKNKFFTFLFMITVLGNILVLAIGYSLRGFIANRYIDTAPEYLNFLIIIGIIIVVNSLFDLFFSYSRTIMKVVLPSFLRDIFLRLAAIALVVGYSVDWWSFEWAVNGLAVNYTLALIILFLQLVIIHNFRFDFHFSVITKDWKRKLSHFAPYSMVLAGSFAVINNITYDQVTAYLGSDANGIFVTCFFIGVIVEMPRRNMSKVMGPIISTAFEKNDFKEIGSLYKRSSITMSAIGMLLFIGIITNLNDLFLFIPKGQQFQAGYGVVLGVCLAKMGLMVSSFPGEIINFSKYYRFNLLFQVIAAIGLVIANSFLISSWGLNGAAFSYSAIILLHVAVMVVFVKAKFNILPFQNKHLVLLIISIVTGVIAWFFRVGVHPVLEILIRSVITTLIFVFLVYRFKVSDDINNLIISILRIKQKITDV